MRNSRRCCTCRPGQRCPVARRRVFKQDHPSTFTRGVDGAENPTALFYTGRSYEAVNYLSRTEHVYIALRHSVAGRCIRSRHRTGHGTDDGLTRWTGQLK
ncbi:hypothetical protein FBQ96_00125 [Nitrospirales bacterium NOB]|nr:hypothetical protein [Nitrospirales bacterium NOB]